MNLALVSAKVLIKSLKPRPYGFPGEDRSSAPYLDMQYNKTVIRLSPEKPRPRVTAFVAQ